MSLLKLLSYLALLLWLSAAKCTAQRDGNFSDEITREVEDIESVFPASSSSADQQSSNNKHKKRNFVRLGFEDTGNELKGEKICNDVPITLPMTCYMEVPFSEPYQCTAPSFVEVCKTQSVDVPAKCFKVVDRQVEFQCPEQAAMEGNCFDIPISTQKMCTRRVTKKVEKSCDKSITSPVCKYVPVDINLKCFRAVEKEMSYPCRIIQQENVCETKYENVPSTCKRTVLSTEEYTYEGVKYENVCKNIEKTREGNCKRTVYDEEEYACNEIVMGKECKDITKVVAVPCVDSTQDYSVVDCSVTEETVVKKPCAKTRTEKVSVTQCSGNRSSFAAPNLPIARTKNGPVRNFAFGTRFASVTKGCTEVPLKIEQTIMEECEEITTVVVPRACPKAETDEVQPMCSTTETEHMCIAVPKTISKKCTRKVPRLEPYPCTGKVLQQECKNVEIPTTEIGYTPTTREETYPCEIFGPIEKCGIHNNIIEDTCAAKIMEIEEYDCKRTIMEKKCEEIYSQIPSICLEEEYVDEEYPCPELSTEKKCGPFPVYKKNGTCTTTVQGVEEYDCVKSELRISCVAEKQNVQQTCYKNIKRKEEYPCFRFATKPVCETITGSYTIVKKDYVKNTSESKNAAFSFREMLSGAPAVKTVS